MTSAPASSARRRAFSSIGSAMSIAVTSPPARAARIATSPVPVARSSTRSPGWTRSRSTSSSCTGANRAAIRSYVPDTPDLTHVRESILSRVSDLFSEAAGRRLDASAPLAQRLRPTTLDDFVGQEHVIGPGRALRLAIEQDRVPSMVLFGPPGSGQDDARAHRRADDGRGVRGALGGLGDRRERARGAGERARAARHERAADDPLPRRDPPLQQGAAGRAAARRRGGPADADRRDDREPVLRGQLGAALAHADLRARAALRRDAARSRAARRRRARRRPSRRRSRS